MVIVEYLGQRSRSAADHIIELPPTLILHSANIRNDYIDINNKKIYNKCI